MSSITTYIGHTGNGMTSVLRKIARKGLYEEKSVLVITPNNFEPIISDSGDLTVVNTNGDIQRVVLAYEITHNGELPDVLVIDGVFLDSENIRDIISLSRRGTNIHIGYRARRDSSTVVTALTLNLAINSDQVYTIQRAAGFDSGRYVLATVSKSCSGEKCPVIFRIDEND